MNDKTHIVVYVTRTLEFRVLINEPSKPIYEVTVGGKAWNEGKGRKFENQIKIKIEKVMAHLSSKMLPK